MLPICKGFHLRRFRYTVYPHVYVTCVDMYSLNMIVGIAILLLLKCRECVAVLQNEITSRDVVKVIQGPNIVS